MDITILQQGTGIAEIILNGKKMLSVTTNLSNRIYKQISRQELLSEPGFIIADNKSVNWICKESIEYRNNLMFPGPFYSGSSLGDINIDIEILLNLAVLFKKIINENIPAAGFYLPGFFVPDSGGILVFPPKLISYVKDQLSEEERIRFWQPFNHPDTDGEKQYSFVLGVLAYNYLAEELPFPGTTQTEIREKMRSIKPLNIELLKPGIKNNIAETVNNSLILKEVSLEKWISVLKKWKKEGALNPISNIEINEIEKIRAAKQKKSINRFKRNQFLSRNWKTILIVAIAAIALGSFISQPIRNALEPPVTAGMNPEEVVRTYYRGIMNLNTELMEDSVKKGVGKNDINEVTQVYIISKVRTGYEGTSGFISAQDWNDGKIKEIKQGEQVYGIADLEIRPLGSLKFQVNYIRWNPDIRDNPDQKEILPPVKTYIKDILILDKHKDNWQIVNIERTTEEQ